MADFLFGILLLLNLTGLFSFAAPFLSVDIAAITIGLLVVNLLYIGYRWPVTRKLLRSPDGWRWTVFLLLWPVATVVYAAEPNLRSLGLQVYYITLFLGAGVYVYVRGWAAFHAIITASIVVTAIGLLLSLMDSKLFDSVAQLAKAQSEYDGRAYGFFLQPNQAAENVTFLVVAWLAPGHRRGLIASLIALLLYYAMIGATGSRGGLLVATVITVLFVFHLFSGRHGRRMRLTRGLRLTLGSMAVVAVLLAVVGAVSVVGDTLAKGDFGRVAERFLFVLQSPASQELSSDASVGERVASLQQYVTLAARRPILGYGIGATAYYLKSGVLFLASHNILAELWFNYGVPYVAFLLYLLYRILRSTARRPVEQKLGSGVYGQISAAILVGGMLSNTILDSRTLIPILGALVSLLAVSDGPHRSRAAAAPAAEPVDVTR